MSSNVREYLIYVRQLSGGSPGCPVVVERPSRMSGCVREALPKARDWSGGLPECPVVVQEDHPYVRSLSGGSPGCLEVVGRPSRMSGSVQEDHL